MPLRRRVPTNDDLCPQADRAIRRAPKGRRSGTNCVANTCPRLESTMLGTDLATDNDIIPIVDDGSPARLGLTTDRRLPHA